MKVFLIDDDLDFCMLMQRYLGKNNINLDYAVNGTEGLASLSSNKYDLLITDFRLPDFDGLEILQKVKVTSPQLPVIFITGYSDLSLAIKVMKRGAYDYITKPVRHEELLQLVLDGLKSSTKPPRTNKVSNATITGQTKYISGKSPQSKEIENQINLVAKTDISVLIEGETGTGKEIVARKIHDRSGRKDAKIITVDCGAIPKDTVDSILFGHEKGAFTGAIKQHIGHFEEANGGTLFLDEIGNLSYDIQIKLLRAIQERRIRRMGGSKDIPVDIRILAATNENLLANVQDGSFREDLYYRLNEFKINAYPLRALKEDIPAFIEYFLSSINEQLGKHLKGIESKAEEKLLQYSWPGNLRELQNVVRRSALLCQTSHIELQDLPREVLHVRKDDNETIDSNEIVALKEVVRKAERKAICSALEHTNFSKSKAATLLEVDRKTLYNKMKQYNIEY